MNFGEIFGRKEHKNSNENLEEIYKIKQEIEKEDKIFEKELPTKYNLLQEFKINELKNLCTELLGQEPVTEYHNDPKLGKVELPILKEDYVQFIIDELRLSQIRNYALKKRVISKDRLKQFDLN